VNKTPERFFYSFKLGRAVRASVNALKAAIPVMVSVVFPEDGITDPEVNKFLDRIRELATSELADLDENLREERLFLLQPMDELHNTDAHQAAIDELRDGGLLILVNQPHRTPAIARILSECPKATIISTSTKRVKLPPRHELEEESWSNHVDPNFLYGRPPLPDFDNLTDEQHNRFVEATPRSKGRLLKTFSRCRLLSGSF
jgi:hypothetical protein